MDEYVKIFSHNAIGQRDSKVKYRIIQYNTENIWCMRNEDLNDNL